MHVVEESPIADHCMAYALSEPRDSSLMQKCNHTNRGPVQITDSSAARHKLGFYHVALHVQHPITWDQYDICAMVKAKSLQKLKLDLLKLLCEKMSINLPKGIDRRRKAPYICLLEDFVKYCPCSTLRH